MKFELLTYSNIVLINYYILQDNEQPRIMCELVNVIMCETSRKGEKSSQVEDNDIST